MSRAFMIKQAPFKPTDIGGCQLWLDLADITSLFQNTAGTIPVTADSQNIQYIKDKSIAGNNASTTATGMIYRARANGGFPSVYFPGTQSLGYTMNLAFGISDATYFFVVNNQTTDGSTTVYFAHVGSSYTKQFWWYSSSLALDIGGIGGILGPTNVNQLTTIVSCTEVASTSILNGWQNGNPFSVTDKNMSGAFNTSYNSGVLGTDNGLYPMTGYVSEVIIFNRILDSSDRPKVEAYLAQKWGLRQQLPQGHPGTRGIVYPSQPIPTAIYWRYDTNPAGISRPANVLPIPPIICSAIYKTTLQTAVFTYIGSLQSFAVPSTISPTTITVYMWGAGGGGYYPTQSYGGAGCYLTGILTVTPAETLYVLVGQGGTIQYPSQTGLSTRFGGGGGIISTGGNGNAQYNGSGGGRSAIQRSSVDIVSAGAGGGCGTQAGSGNGHDGGTGSWTGTGGNGANDKYGLGGTQTSGGASQGNGAAGTALVGGRADPWGGGGGGGFFGGGAGSDNNSYGSGGGGGSSYTDLLSSKSGSNGTLNVAPNTASPYYISGVAVGGTQALSGNGGNGLIVITYYA